MKIAFITPCATRLAGGIFEIERRLAQSLAELPDTSVRVFSPGDAHTEDDQPAWLPLVPRAFPYTGPAAFRYSSALRRAVLADDSEVAHLHALWMHTSLVTRAWHRRGDRPYVTTLNGMLEPWALRNSAWKKRLAAALFERDCLNRAACLQVNTEGELQSARAFGLRNPVCIIPNGIDLPTAPQVSASQCFAPSSQLPASPPTGSPIHRSTETPPSALRPPSSVQQYPLRLDRGEGQGEVSNQSSSAFLRPPSSVLVAPPWAGRVEPGRKVLLYLGRLHPKKGLVNLLKAWAKLSPLSTGSPSSDWTLAIAGWDQGGHEAELKKLCDELGLAWGDIRDTPLPSDGRGWPGGTGEGSRQPDEVRHTDDQGGQGEVSISTPAHTSSLTPHPSVWFLGPQHGAAKAACYANCDAFILPSFSEGLPMVVLEAWSHAKPVLMTPECNLTHAYAAGAALRIDPNPESIARGLSDLLHAPGSTLLALGESGLRLVRERYQWSAVARQLREVYAWLLGGGQRPGSVVLS